MYNKKIAYYRKKNMMTQEELAEKIQVSRQTITKWEAGMITPNLESIIDLSHVFGVTIDSLIKDDDCISEEESALIDNDQLVTFLLKAKQSTYASRLNKVKSLRNGATDYKFIDNDYTYNDSFFGTERFSGQEIVYKHDRVCWSMNYYGNVLSHDFSGDFLKSALLEGTITMPFRGPNLYTKGDYTYTCHVLGDLNSFKGHEIIYYKTKEIYTCEFHGGYIQ